MYNLLTHLPIRFLLTLSLTAIAATQASAQGLLRVYGSEGPAPAINEAAAVFGAKNNLKVNVVSGPPEKWLADAQSNADVIYSEFMMSDFIANPDLGIDPDSVTPLYLRPSAVLVRPGNPKHIRDFPDLLKSRVGVMVVSGAGQVGLWEDMAGKQGDIRVIRAFRKNIVFFAANSAEAMKTWDDRDDIDAWVTWNIWHMPLRDRAELVQVGDDYLIHRQCSIAITERAKANPLAEYFINFLKSPEGAKIFHSWYWTKPPNDSSPLTVNNDIAIVCRIDSDDCKNGVGLGLGHVRGLVQAYKSLGTPPTELHIKAVIHGPAGYWLLKDQAYSAFSGKGAGNPNKAIVRELNQLGVSIELCGATMKEQGWTENDVLRGVKIVPNAYPRIVDLELQGYAYIRF